MHSGFHEKGLRGVGVEAGSPYGPGAVICMRDADGCGNSGNGGRGQI